MIENIINKTKVLSFTSSNDILDYCSDGKKTYSVTYDEPNYCDVSYDEAMNQLVNGLYIENASSKRAYFSGLLASKLQKIESMHYDYTGSMVDVGLFLSGEPQNMLEFTEQAHNKETLNVYIEQSFPWFVDQVIIQNRSIAISSLVDSLIDNYNVNLSVIISTFDEIQKDKNWIQEYRINTDNGYSFNQLLFTTSKGFLRRIHFKIAETLAKRDRLSGYGRHMDIEVLNKTLKKLSAGDKYIYFDSINKREEIAGYETPELAINSIIKLAKENNIEFN